MFNFTGSASVSTCATVTGRSNAPVSATINPVKSLVVLAGARIWSGFFSNRTAPVRTLITMTELALTLGIDPGTVCVDSDSSCDSRDFVARCVRRGLGVGLASESESVFAGFDFERDRCAGTPLGLISFGFSWSGEIGVSAATHVNASRIAANQKSKRRFTGRLIHDKDSNHASGGYKSSPR